MNKNEEFDEERLYNAEFGILSKLSLIKISNRFLVKNNDNNDNTDKQSFFIKLLIFVHNSKIYDVIFTKNNMTLSREIYFLYQKSIDYLATENSFTKIG